MSSFILKEVEKEKLYEFLREMEFNKLLSRAIGTYGEIGNKKIKSVNSKIYSNTINVKAYECITNEKMLDKLIVKSNFNYLRIQNLFSNLSSLSLIELFELRTNYKQINYSTSEIDLQLQKLISFPFYFTLMTILAAIIMFNTKQFRSYSLKITIGLFICVIIYYIKS